MVGPVCPAIVWRLFIIVANSAWVRLQMTPALRAACNLTITASRVKVAHDADDFECVDRLGADELFFGPDSRTRKQQ
jgi:hypothetical protein